jgi:hypothetical protein
MTMTTPGEGPVEQYLDEMFDRLAGTGSAGRRILGEAESHLLASAEEGRARGLDVETAEREAVERFGSVNSIVRQVPVAAGEVRVSLRHMLIATWAVAGAASAWYGVSGVVTWLLGWPWTWLLIATDRFGAQPDMCGRPWVPTDPAGDCFTQYREYLYVVPAGGDRFLYQWFAVGGLVLLLALLVVRRTTVLGTAAWTPRQTLLGLAIGGLFGLVSAVLLFYGVIGVVEQAQEWALSYLVPGLLASVISVAAFRRVWMTSSAASAHPPRMSRAAPNL